MDIPKFGNLGIRRFGILGIWKFANLLRYYALRLVSDGFQKFQFVYFFPRKKLSNLATTAIIHTQLKAGGHRICFEARARCANLGSGHILSPLWDGVYGERWGWAAADVAAGPT